MDKPIKLPGPDHVITITPSPSHVVVTHAGRVIADTTGALLLREANHDDVLYIPRSDVTMSLLERTSHSSYCPYKGDAAYFSIVTDTTRAENAVWTYEAPYPAVAAIKAFVAFYPDRVHAIDVSP
jgi:uncharacterized protein (DUF427 family)